MIAGLVMLCGAAAIAVRRQSGPPALAGTDRRLDALRGLLGIALAASAVRFLFALVLPALWAVSILDRVSVRRAQLRVACVLASVAVLVFFPAAHLRAVSAGVRASGWGYLGADSPSFPSEAAAYLASSGLTGNLAHSASWGGYLGWKLSPRFKTATDGRVTHFGPDLAREWSEGIDSPAREEIFARRGIDLVVIPRPMLSKFRDDQPYQAIHGGPDSFAIVLLRLGGPHDAENRLVLKEAAKRRR